MGYASLQRQLREIAAETGRAGGVLDLARNPVSAAEYAELEVLKKQHPKHLLEKSRKCSKEAPLNHDGQASQSTEANATVANAQAFTAASCAGGHEAEARAAANLDTTTDVVDGDEA